MTCTMTPKTDTTKLDRRPFALRAALSNALFLVYVIALALILMELVLRTTHLFGARVIWTERDPVLGWRFIPGHAYWHRQENDHAITGRINKYGWRDVDWSLRKPANAYRIAVLGDSFVEAVQVESDRTFLSLASKRLSAKLGRPVEMMSFGRSGFTQTEEYLVLQRDVARFAPDIVIAVFFPGNDIADVSRETARNRMRPFFSMTGNGRLVLDTSFNRLREYRHKSALYELQRYSALLSLVAEKRSALRQQKWTDGATPSETRLRGYMTLCTRSPDPVYVRNYRLNKALIEAMAEYCRRREIRFVLVCVDTEGYRPETERKWTRLDPSVNVNFFDDDLARYSRSLGIEFIGLQRAFRRSYEESRTPLHFGAWGHWNYRGHDLVADVLAEKLTPVLESPRR
jgi:hypothetical protein